MNRADKVTIGSRAKFTSLQVLLPYYEGPVYAVTNQKPSFHDVAFVTVVFFIQKYYDSIYIIMCKNGACMVYVK